MGIPLNTQQMQVLETMPPGYAIIYRDLSAGQAIDIRVSGRVAISSPGGVQVQAGADGGTQVLAAWYDPWARPRAIAFTGVVTVTGTSWIAVCNAIEVSGANYDPSSAGTVTQSRLYGYEPTSGTWIPVIVDASGSLGVTNTITIGP